MVLGTNEVRLIDLTQSFAVISAKGKAVEPYGITKVATTDGEVLYQREKKDLPTLVPAYVTTGITDGLFRRCAARGMLAVHSAPFQACWGVAAVSITSSASIAFL